MKGVEIRELLAARDGGLCHVCGGALNLTLSPEHPLGPTIDHVLPRANGGTDSPENLRLAHKRCNSDRGSLSQRRAAEIGVERLRRVIAVAAAHGWACRWCHRSVDPATARSPGEYPVLFLVRLRRDGGEDTIENTRLAHLRCNANRRKPRRRK